MKKILLINQDQKFIGDLQTKFSRRYEILATENYETAYQLCRTFEIDLLLARMAPENVKNRNIQLKRFLKKINQKKFSHITKVLTVSEQNEYHLEEFLKYGIAALVMNVEEMERWLQ